MTRTEKSVARKLTDSITLRDVNDALINMPTTEELGPLPSFDEHNEFVRQTIYGGANV
jgi:hypothetical protein